MTFTPLALVVFVVTSSTALAEEPLLTPTWSLGAGLSFGSAAAYGLGGLVGATPGGLGGATAGGLSVLASPYLSVAPNVSLERQFSTRFALGLGLGLEAGVNTSSTVGATRPSPASGSAAIGISPRFTLTSESAPVAFTVLATVFTGYAGYGGVLTIGAPAMVEATYTAQTFSVGVLGGIALEKRFLERFAVRIQAQLARVALNRQWNSYPSFDQATGTVLDNRNVSSFVNASFVPSPSIELRLYL